MSDVIKITDEIINQPKISKSYIRTRLYISGRLTSRYHREDGPAVIWKNGHVEWYIEGHEVASKLEEMPLSLFLAYCKHNIYNNSK